MGMSAVLKSLARFASSGKGDKAESPGDLVRAADTARDLRLWPLAAAQYLKALKSDARLPAIWVQLGHALKEMNSLTSSESSYRRSLALSPLIADTHLQLGHVLKLQGRIRDAAESYLEALTHDVTNVHARNELVALGFAPDAVVSAIETTLLPGYPYLANHPLPRWELVADGLDRIEVTGGWLYRCRYFAGEAQASCTLMFVGVNR